MSACRLDELLDALLAAHARAVQADLRAADDGDARADDLADERDRAFKDEKARFVAELEADTSGLRSALAELADLMDAVRAGDHEPDSFTCQPARTALSGAAGRPLLDELQAAKAERDTARAEVAALREQLDAIEEQRRIANATEGVTRPHDAWSTPSGRQSPTTAEWVRLLRERWQVEADCRRAADEKAAALRERAEVAEAAAAALRDRIEAIADGIRGSRNDAPQTLCEELSDAQDALRDAAGDYDEALATLRRALTTETTDA